MTRPLVEALIDLDAIAHNARVIRSIVGAARVMGVVKADAYNHGAVRVAKTLLESGVDELGVATLSEALELSDAGITAPITSWLHNPDADFTHAVRAGIDIAVSSPRELASVITAARMTGKTATVSVKVDTGLRRNGVSPEQWSVMLADLQSAVRSGAVVVRTMFCHFVAAEDTQNPVTDRQTNLLLDHVASARAAGVDPQLVHCCNSAGTLLRPEYHFDMVRPGIALYGYSPVEESFGLRPAMTLSARVAHVKSVRAGEGVSYGHTWIAHDDTRVALLPIGYADGLPRALANRFSVSIKGRSYPGVGKICMDQCVIDIGRQSDVTIGDTAIIFGPDGVTATDLANSVGTIDYEVITMVRGRTARRYVGGSVSDVRGRW